MNSEDEAYDPWPNCVMDRTGCHGHCHYRIKYRISDKMAAFFSLEPDSELTLNRLDDIVIEYAEKHNGVSTHGVINYDESLWNLFEIEHNKTFKFYQIEKYMRRSITQVSD